MALARGGSRGSGRSDVSRIDPPLGSRHRHCSGLVQATVTIPAATSRAIYPLKVGPTGRYLVDQRNVPFMVVGDSPQALTMNLWFAEAEEFLANRRAAGYNSMWVNLLCIICTSLAGGRTDGTTYDGIPPFKTPATLDAQRGLFRAG